MKTFFYKIIDRLLAVLSVFLFSQLPAFIHQYTCVLYGHLQECKRMQTTLEMYAQLHNKTVSEYIDKFLIQKDPDFVHQGKWMLANSLRYEKLALAYEQLTDASLWKKPFVFFANIDMSIACDTISQFAVSISISFETGVYILVGLYFWSILSAAFFPRASSVLPV